MRSIGEPTVDAVMRDLYHVRQDSLCASCRWLPGDMYVSPCLSVRGGVLGLVGRPVPQGVACRCGVRMLPSGNYVCDAYGREPGSDDSEWLTRPPRRGCIGLS
jgi:hypothetical protein